MEMITYNEADAVKRILRHHGVVNAPLEGDLEVLLDWIHQRDQARTSLVSGTEPMPLISLLGSMGIYGAEILDTVEGENSVGCQGSPATG